MLKAGWMNIPYLSDGLIEYSQIVVGTLILRALYGMKWKLCWFTTLIISVTSNAGSYLGLLFMPYRVIHLAVIEERLTYMFFLWVVSPLFLILVLVVLYKTGAGRHYRQWLNYGVVRKDMLIFMSSYPLLLTFISRMIEQFESENGNNLMITNFSTYTDLHDFCPHQPPGHAKKSNQSPTGKSTATNGLHRKS